MERSDLLERAVSLCSSEFYAELDQKRLRRSNIPIRGQLGHENFQALNIVWCHVEVRLLRLAGGSSGIRTIDHEILWIAVLRFHYEPARARA